MKNDYQFVKELLNRFVSNGAIKKKLKYFTKEDCNNWECWLQLEFYFFLSHDQDVAEIHRECSYSVRGNARIQKKTARVDFAIRKKKLLKIYTL